MHLVFHYFITYAKGKIQNLNVHLIAGFDSACVLEGECGISKNKSEYSAFPNKHIATAIYFSNFFV